MNMEEFKKAIAKLPPSIECFSNGAVCPWCGEVHKTITFGQNLCVECSRGFWFGYPDWYEGKEPISHVPFPHWEFDALGGKADLLPDWEPTELLKLHYHTIAERKTGIVSRKQ